MTLRNRLKKLEGGSGGEKCSACGFIPGEKIEYIITMRDELPEAEPEAPLEPESCPECGRPLRLDIKWSDTLEPPPIPPLGEVRREVREVREVSEIEGENE
jgi:hypothetical protein